MIAQDTLDEQMVERAIKRDRTLRTLGIRKSTETWNGPVKKLLLNSIHEVAKGIEEWVEDALTKPGVRHTSVKHLSLFTPHQASALVCRVILDAISSERTISSVAVKIGHWLEDEARLSGLKKSDPIYFNNLTTYMQKKKGHHFRLSATNGALNRHGKDGWARWLPTERLHVGLACLEIFKERTGLIEFSKRYLRAKKAMTYVIPTEDCMEWLKDYGNSHEALRPVYLPMADSPQLWTSPTTGGYTADFKRPLSIVKTDNPHLRRELENFPMPEVYASVNRLQSVAWQINDRLYKVMRHFWDQGLDDKGGIPMNRTKPLPPKPHDIEENLDSVRAYCRKATQVYHWNVCQKTNRIAIAKIIHTADTFRGQPLYFPVQCDFRGRAYYVPTFLNPQGNGYARALLEFAEAKPLGGKGADWLRVHIANCFGEDKLPFPQRIEWVEENRQRIMECAADPYSNRWWSEADEPWMFLRACIEYQEYSHDPQGFRSRLPVLLDASSNGLQILSLLMRDTQGAIATNCAPSDQPQDIYMRVVGELERILKDRHELYAADWLNFGITRSLVKQPVMTLPYGATTYGFANQIETAAMAICNDRDLIWDEQDVRKSTMWLAKRLVTAIDRICPRAAETMMWLQGTASEVLKVDKPVAWVSPCGFLVHQGYMLENKRSVKTTIAGEFRYVVLSERIPDSINKRRHKQAVAPNFVHSLDASVMHKTVNKTDFDIVTIHDCFGAHAGDIDELLRATKASFVEVFTPCQLDNFQGQMERVSGKPLESNKKILNFGDFEIAKVKESNYLFG